MSSTISVPVGSTGNSAKPFAKRIVSLDALRGFDMFWIVGMEGIIHALSTVINYPLITRMDHVPWQGLHFYDFIFPLFVFIIGVSLVFSLSKTLETEGQKAATIKVIRRGLILYVLGLIYYGGISQGLDKVRLVGVLQRLAICYTFAGLAFIWFKTRGRIVTCAFLLIGYWAVMTFVPVPGVGAGNFDEGKNLANYVDREFLPFRKWDGDHDPEGLLSNIPAIAQCILGLFAGLLLKNSKTPDKQKVRWLLLGGIAFIILGFLWGLQFPIIKKIWSSSFVLVTTGVSVILLATFYQIIDVWNHQKWAAPFVWIGCNAITIYLTMALFDFGKLASLLLGGPITEWLDHRIAAGFGHLVIEVTVLMFGLLLARFLYQRKIFLRV
jgi:predicted acyltransferase